MPGRLLIDGTLTEELEGLTIRTFVEDPRVVRFPPQGRRARATEVVLHETVTTSVDATVQALVNQHLSVHLIVGPDGEVTQHADLATDVCWHAGKHNVASFGIEVVNPYYPRFLRRPWQTIIKAPWADGRLYVVPTPEQAEATALLLGYCVMQNSPEVWEAGGPPAAYGGLQIPPTWVGKTTEGFVFGRIDAAKTPGAGVYAHHYFGHADGAWLALYSWLRLVAGLSSDAAYREAVQRATGAQRYVSVADLEPCDERTDDGTREDATQRGGDD